MAEIVYSRYCMCRGKKPFRTRALARHSCETIRKYQKAERMHPYFCKFCKCWHIGHALDARESYERPPLEPLRYAEEHDDTIPLGEAHDYGLGTGWLRECG